MWTRELIDAVLAVGGTYYLPYQPHATAEQFHRAYPRAKELFALKRKLDPRVPPAQLPLGQVLRTARCEPQATPAASTGDPSSTTVYSRSRAGATRSTASCRTSTASIPEDRFHTLIKEAAARTATTRRSTAICSIHLPNDQAASSPSCPTRCPRLPSRSRRWRARRVELLGSGRAFDGYVEIGTTGRYAGALRKRLRPHGAAGAGERRGAQRISPVDIVERGRLAKVGSFVPLGDYEPHPGGPRAGREHRPRDVLHRPASLPAGPKLGRVRGLDRAACCGRAVCSSLRDHDVTSPDMDAFVALAHTVFNAGLGVPWETNRRSCRHFAPIAEWVRRLEAAGLPGHRPAAAAGARPVGQHADGVRQGAAQLSARA